ncbi:hypothetical protein GCM10008938_18750 [Deinococcus roseus]|uniref:Uncharacterized protein n=1 Tax=Deinococcus roseus TaxID=392414 RepID=A0ABQ2CYE6_9DEIO|nr:hypothetical protein GCM10008938_18750 [Deinococcus roseus]
MKSVSFGRVDLQISEDDHTERKTEQIACQNPRDLLDRDLMDRQANENQKSRWKGPKV